MKQIAKYEDKPCLIELYNICFPGEDEYCEKFFELVWKPENTLVYRADGKVVSMLQMFDLNLTDGNREYSAYYIFGAATHPEYRGMSIMRELIAESERINFDKDFSVLIAASESLKSFYGKLGYKVGFSLKKEVVSAGNFDITYKLIDFAECGEIEAVSAADEMNKIYHNAVRGLVAVKRNSGFIATELSCREAKLFLSDSSYAIAEFSEDEVLFTEYFGGNSKTLMSQILWDNKADNAQACSIGDTHSFGMYKNLSCDNEIRGYLNLLFN